MKIRVRLALLVALLLAAGSAGAQFPEKPIRLIVPQAPGSATDTLARLLAPEYARQLGGSIVVENRPGGALVIGLEMVARAAPDGYTIGLGPVGGMAISPNMVEKLPYDILRDFQPIGLIARGHILLAVSPKLPVKNVAELIAYARQNPGKLTNASSASVG